MVDAGDPSVRIIALRALGKNRARCPGGRPNSKAFFADRRSPRQLRQEGSSEPRMITSAPNQGEPNNPLDDKVGQRLSVVSICSAATAKGIRHQREGRRAAAGSDSKGGSLAAARTRLRGHASIGLRGYPPPPCPRAGRPAQEPIKRGLPHQFIDLFAQPHAQHRTRSPARSEPPRIS